MRRAGAARLTAEMIGLPSRGSTVRVVVDGRTLTGLVDGYCLRLTSPGSFMWLRENPGVGEMTRVRVEAIKDWGHVS